MPKSIREILEKLFNDGIGFDKAPYGREKYLIESLSDISDWLESKKMPKENFKRPRYMFAGDEWNSCIDELKKGLSHDL